MSLGVGRISLRCSIVGLRGALMRFGSRQMRVPSTNVGFAFVLPREFHVLRRQRFVGTQPRQEFFEFVHALAGTITAR